MCKFKFSLAIIIYFLIAVQPAQSTEVVACISCDSTQMQQLAGRTPLFGSLLVFDPTNHNANKYLISNYQTSQRSSIAVPIYLPPNEQAFVVAMSDVYSQIGNKKHLEVTLKLGKIDAFKQFNAREVFSKSYLKQQLGDLVAKNFDQLAEGNKQAILMMKTMKLAVKAMLKVDLSMTLIVQCSDSSQIVYKIEAKKALLAEYQRQDSRNFDSHHQVLATN
ncbi:MAG: hypothetical protein Q9M92_02060 [Enterobacterales bacterium]|nr:hypothetical protein [Enterobacterales bacterium]